MTNVQPITLNSVTVHTNTDKEKTAQEWAQAAGDEILYISSSLPEHMQAQVHEFKNNMVSIVAKYIATAATHDRTMRGK